VAVARIECWLVGSYDSTCHGTSTVLRLHSSLFLLCFPLFFLCSLFFFACFLCFSSIFSVFLLGSSVFPLYSLFISLNSINNLPILLTNCVTFLVFMFLNRPTDPTQDLYPDYIAYQPLIPVDGLQPNARRPQFISNVLISSIGKIRFPIMDSQWVPALSWTLLWQDLYSITAPSFVFLE